MQYIVAHAARNADDIFVARSLSPLAAAYVMRLLLVEEPSPVHGWPAEGADSKHRGAIDQLLRAHVLQQTEASSA